MNTKYNLILRTDRNPEKSPIYIRIIINNKRHLITTNIIINSKSWNSQKEQLNNNYNLYFEHYQRLESIKTKLNELITKEYINKNSYSIDDFKNYIFNNNKDDFKLFIENEIKKRSKLVSKSTTKGRIVYLSIILKYKQYINIKDINKDFIKNFTNYLIDRKLKETSIGKALGMLKLFLNWSKEAELIEKNPFDNIKISKGEGHRNFLNKQELEKLFDFYKNNTLPNYQQNILKLFLFACFTGLRYQDIYNLKWFNIDNEFIDIVQHKTKERVRIFINKHIFEILQNETKTKENIFNVPCNQVVNRNLKIIMQQLEINKIMSFHCARHTFATISLTLKIPIEVISKTLGHNKISTTQIYAKLVDEVKKEQLSKWDDVF